MQIIFMKQKFRLVKKLKHLDKILYRRLTTRMTWKIRETLEKAEGVVKM